MMSSLHLTNLLIGLLFSSLAYGIECPAGEYPVRSHPRVGYYRDDGTFVSPATVKEQCRPFRISIPPVLIFNSGMPDGWPNPLEKFKPWTKEEEKKVREAMASLPKVLTHLGKINFHRANSGLFPDNPSVSSSADRIITLYDSAGNHDYKKIISHELAHFFWDSLIDSEREDYNVSAKWVFYEGNYMTKRTQFSEADGFVGPHEDFSNNVEAFLFARNKINAEKEILECLKRMLK